MNNYSFEKRPSLLYATTKDGKNLSPTMDALYGPYESFEDAQETINEFCAELGVKVPKGIKFAVDSADGYKEYQLKNNSNLITAESVVEQSSDLSVINDLSERLHNLEEVPTAGYATTEDLNQISEVITELQNAHDNFVTTEGLNDAYNAVNGLSTRLDAAENAITDILNADPSGITEDQLNNVLTAYAKNSDVDSVDNKVEAFKSEAESVFAKSEDLSALQSTVEELSNIDHSNFAKKSQIEALSMQLNAAVSAHEGFAAADHTHDQYATKDELSSAIDDAVKAHVDFLTEDAVSGMIQAQASNLTEEYVNGIVSTAVTNAVADHANFAQKSDLVGLATEEFVNTAIAGVDHSSYATHDDLNSLRSDVNTAIAAHDNFATIEYVDNAVATVGSNGSVDLSSYATKTYVDSEIAKVNVGGGSSLSDEQIVEKINEVNNTKIQEFGKFTINGKTVDEAVAEGVITCSTSYGHLNITINLDTDLFTKPQNIFNIKGYLKGTITLNASNNARIVYNLLESPQVFSQTVDDVTYEIHTDGAVKEWWLDDILLYVQYSSNNEISSVAGKELKKYHKAEIVGDDYVIYKQLSTKINFVGNTLIENEQTSQNIIYKLSTGKLAINFENNAVVYLSNTANTTNPYIASDAVLQSNKNMELTGIGSLTVTAPNHVCHAVKAEELTVDGNIFVYADVNHDALHGTKSVTFYNGSVYVKNAKDGFGTGNDGHVEIYYGTFKCEHVKENFIDSKQPGAVYCSIDRFDSISRNWNGVSVIDPATVYGQGEVMYYDAADVATPAAISGDTYNVPSTVVYVTVKGYVNARFVFSTAKQELVLDHAYLTYNGDNPVVYYSIKSSNLSIKTVKGSGVSYIMHTSTNFASTHTLDLDAIKAENNLKLTPKSGSVLYVSASAGDAIDASDLTIYNGAGSIYAVDSYRCGIKAKGIYIGNEYDTTGWVDNDINTGKSFSGNVYAFGNVLINNGDCNTGVADSKEYGFADIYARNGRTYSKGELRVQAYNEDADLGFEGYVYCKSFNSFASVVTNNQVCYATTTTSVSGKKYTIPALGYAPVYVETVNITNKNISEFVSGSGPSQDVSELVALVNSLKAQIDEMSGVIYNHCLKAE